MTYAAPLTDEAHTRTASKVSVAGFDVYMLGDKDHGERGFVCAALLILAWGAHGLGARVIQAKRSRRRADPVWVDFDEAALELNETSGDIADRLEYGLPRRRGGVHRAVFSVHPTEEPRNG